MTIKILNNNIKKQIKLSINKYLIIIISKTYKNCNLSKFNQIYKQLNYIKTNQKSQMFSLSNYNNTKKRSK